MEVKKESRWINQKDCGKDLLIVGFEPKEKLLLLSDGEEDFMKIQLFGKNWNFMVNYSKETDHWIGKIIKIRQDIINTKNIRLIVSIQENVN